MVHSQNTVEEAYAMVGKARQLKGRAAQPLLEDVRAFCYSRACPDSVVAKMYYRLAVAYFQAAIDDEP